MPVVPPRSNVPTRCFALALAAALASPASAQSYPQRPIKVLVPSGPGVPPDIIARLVAAPLAARLGQPVVVENRPGGTLAAVSVAEAPADGYTIGLAHTGFSIAPSLMARAGYDAVKSFTPVGRIATAPLLLLVNAAVPAGSVQELVALARAKPRELHFIAPTGTLPHLAGYLLMSAAGIQLTPVPYKSASLAYPDFVAGRVQLLFDLMTPHRSQIQSGKIRALAVAGPKRNPELHDVPTAAEAGLPDLQAMAFFGLVAPAGTPAAIVTRLNAELGQVLETQALADALRRQGLDPAGTTPEQFAAFIAGEVARWAQAVKASGAKVE